MNAKQIIKHYMIRTGTTLQDLHPKVVDAGYPMTRRSLSNKISRGGFSADFFVTVLTLMGWDFNKPKSENTNES